MSGGSGGGLVGEGARGFGDVGEPRDWSVIVSEKCLVLSTSLNILDRKCHGGVGDWGDFVSRES